MKYPTRYAWFVVDGRKTGLVLVPEVADRGRTIFELPDEYLHCLGLQGGEITPATCGEAAEYLTERLKQREEQLDGTLTPEYHMDWLLTTDLLSRADGLEN